MGQTDSSRSAEELVEDDVPKNSQMETGKDKRVRPIGFCVPCSKLSRTLEGRVNTPAIGVTRINEKLVPVCRIHRGPSELMSFKDAWEEWCVQSIHDS